VPTINRPSVYADLVAVSAPFLALEPPVMAFLAGCLQVGVVTPEQIRVAVVRYQVVDYRSPWVRLAISEQNAALLASVEVALQYAPPRGAPSASVKQRAGHGRNLFPPSP